MDHRRTVSGAGPARVRVARRRPPAAGRAGARAAARGTGPPRGPKFQVELRRKSRTQRTRSARRRCRLPCAPGPARRRRGSSVVKAASETETSRPGTTHHAAAPRANGTRIKTVLTSLCLTRLIVDAHATCKHAQNCVGRQAARAPRRMRTHTAVGPAGERASARERAGMFSRVASVIASAAGALLVPARARAVHGPIRLNPEFDTSGRDVWPHTALPRTPIFMLHAVFKYEIVAAARSRYQRPGRRQDACRRPRRR